MKEKQLKTRIEELDKLIKDITKEISDTLVGFIFNSTIIEMTTLMHIAKLIDLRVKYEIERAKLEESFSN